MKFDEKERKRLSNCIALAALDSDSEEELQSRSLPKKARGRLEEEDDETKVNRNLEKASKLLKVLDSYILKVSQDTFSQ